MRELGNGGRNLREDREITMRELKSPGPNGLITPLSLHTCKCKQLVALNELVCENGVLIDGVLMGF